MMASTHRLAGTSASTVADDPSARSNPAATPAEPLPAGTCVVYYNRWSGYDNPLLRRMFLALSADEVDRLRVGDQVWLDDEPHPAGKVYGFLKLVIARIGTTGRSPMIDLSAGPGGGIAVSISRDSNSLYKVGDEVALAGLVAAEPSALYP